MHYKISMTERMQPNNFAAALALMKSTERRLIRMGMDYAQMYNRQIREMLEGRVARKLSKEEILEYKEVVHYIPYHEGLKPESVSTPMGIVFNSSSSYMCHALNDYWPKGLNMVIIYQQYYSLSGRRE